MASAGQAMRTKTSAAWLQELCCPACKVQLRSGDGDVVCPGCGQSWPVRDGIPNFVSSFPYWGEIPQETMTDVLRQGAKSWRDALLTSEDPLVKRASEMILNLDRANWSLLADLPSQSRVLDIGAGMGANSHSLALRYDHVVAVEPVTERVRFMSQRFEQEGIRNVRIIQTSLWDLPFPDGSFDLIVMNGVLEWVATGRKGSPRRLQETALKAAARLLKPGGVLYVGIENRFTAGYFVGYPDPHSGMPWVTVLPRLLANFYARRKGAPEGYRNYLYSAAGYRSLLRKSGFAAVDCYLAIPSYNHPKFYVPLDDQVFSYFLRTFSGNSKGLRQIVRWFMLRLRLAKHLEYSFALLATK